MVHLSVKPITARGSRHAVKRVSMSQTQGGAPIQKSATRVCGTGSVPHTWEAGRGALLGVSTSFSATVVPFRLAWPWRTGGAARACLPYLGWGSGQSGWVTSSRYQVFTDAQWARVAPLLPSNAGRRGHPFGDDRRVVEAIAYRYRTGIPWRDLPREVFGPWQTAWKRHRRYAADGTWDRVLGRLLAEADAAGQVDWTVSVDATIARAHQHGTNTTRPDQDTGGGVESQESARQRV